MSNHSFQECLANKLKVHLQTLEDLCEWAKIEDIIGPPLLHDKWDKSSGQC